MQTNFVNFVRENGNRDADSTLFGRLLLLAAGAWVLTGCVDSATGLTQGCPFETDEEEIENAAVIASNGGEAIFYDYRHRRTGREVIVLLSRSQTAGPWTMTGFEQLGFMRDAWISKRMPAALHSVHATVRAPDRVLVQ